MLVVAMGKGGTYSLVYENYANQLYCVLQQEAAIPILVLDSNNPPIHVLSGKHSLLLCTQCFPYQLASENKLS